MVYTGLSNIHELVDVVKKNYPLREVYSLLTSITKHHRIQGSSGLWSAVREVKSFLEENDLDTRVYSIENGFDLGLSKTPIGWDLVYGEVVVRENGVEIARLDTIRHPTLVIAHSPSGFGKASIEFVKLENLEKASGKIALTNDPPYLVYKLGFKHGLEAIGWYSIQRYRDAVPYAGYFLEPSEEPSRVPGFTLPNSLVQRIMSKISRGSRIDVEWNIDTKFHSSGLPILETCIGDGEYVVTATAHICHPIPGAHDNASGSAVLAGIAIVLNRLYSKLGLKTRICLYWVPEYTGTIALFIKDILGENVIGNLNLDMVGSRQEVTGSTLHHIRSLLANAGALTPITWLSIEAVYKSGRAFHGQRTIGTIRYDSIPYGNGSDHDVFNINGVEGVMFNEWPSKYYHTDLDAPDTIGYRELLDIGVASTLSLILYSNPCLVNGLVDYIRSYYSGLFSWYVMESVSRGASQKFVSGSLSKYIALALNRGVKWVEEGVFEKPCCIEEGCYRGYTYIPLRRIALELGINYYRLVASRKYLTLLVSSTLPALLKKCYDTREVVSNCLAEQVIDLDKLDIACLGYRGVKCVERLVEEITRWLIKKKLLV